MATMAYTPEQQARLRAAQSMGFTGNTVGDGSIFNWAKANGITDAQFQKAMDQQMNPQPNPQDYNGGVAPVGVVEPLNQYQKTALQGLAQPLQQAPDYGWLQAGVAPMTDATYQEGISRYSNPYTQQVIDRTAAAYNKQGDIARNRVMGSRSPASRSFGDSAMAIQLGQVEDSVARHIGDYTAKANSDNFMQASDNTVNQFNTQGNRYLQGDIALRDRTQQVNDTTVTGFKNMLGAGNVIQGNNQNLLDVVRGEISGVRNFPYDNISRLGQNLGQFPGSGIGAIEGRPNNWSALGGLGMSLSGMGGGGGMFGGMGGMF